jgi:hypothetical protein
MVTPLNDWIAYGKFAWGVISGGWKFIRGRKRGLTPQEKLEFRAKWKPEVVEWLLRQYRDKLRRDVIPADW